MDEKDNASKGIEHGAPGRCPTCQESGTWDLIGLEINFEDSIYYNKACNCWECTTCWTK